VPSGSVAPTRARESRPPTPWRGTPSRPAIPARSSHIRALWPGFTGADRVQHDSMTDVAPLAPKTADRAAAETMQLDARGRARQREEVPW
jgi:hypothetical protein